MRKAGYPLVALATVVLLAGTAVGALAQASYDTPQVSFLDAGYFQIAIRVQAGTSGTPAGFMVQWMTRSDYETAGGWPSSADDPRVFRCEFTGNPTLNPDPGASTFRLGANEAIRIEVGDLFDETGTMATYADPLPDGTEFVFRVLALGSEETPASEPVVAGTEPAPECTQGFWKNHPELWPEGCTPMLLGTVSYTMSELLAIYATPAMGNGLISLVHQLITTKLNICNGSDPTPVAAEIAAADALIDGLVVPPIGTGYIDPSVSSYLTQRLDMYNNGKLGGVANCPTKILSRTWGSVKALYR